MSTEDARYADLSEQGSPQVQGTTNMSESGDCPPFGTDTPANSKGGAQREAGASELKSEATTVDDSKPLAGTRPAAANARRPVDEDQQQQQQSTKAEAILGFGFLLSIVAIVCLAVAVAAVSNNNNADNSAAASSTHGGLVIVPGHWANIVPVGASPPPRLAHAAATVGERYLYIHGGLYGNGNQSLADLWRYDEREDTWAQLQPTGDVPSARLHHSLVSVDDRKLVLFGGFNYFNTQPSHTGLADMYSLDLATLVWTRLDTTASGAARPGIRGAHDAVYVGNYMWLFGGFATIGATGHHEELWRWESATNTWANMTAPLGQGPEGRIGFALTEVDNSLYLFGGGCESTGQCNDTWVYDTSSNAWSQQPVAVPSPSARRATHGDIGVFGILYLFGGVHIAVVNGAPQVTMLDDFWAYDPTANRWIELHPNFGRGPKPPKVFGHSVSRIGSRVVIFGGRVNSPASPGSNQLWEYEAIRPQ